MFKNQGRLGSQCVQKSSAVGEPRCSKIKGSGGANMFKNQVRLGSQCIQKSSAAGEPMCSKIKRGKRGKWPKRCGKWPKRLDFELL